MNILGIETSCDETAAAIVNQDGEIISDIVASSLNLHKKTGGIIPEQAARAQIESIIAVIDESVGKNNVDAIAVTYGPGLIGSLLVGVETAKALALIWDKPIIPVNHLTAHLYANYLNGSKPNFPLIGLVVSGGHTDLIHMKDHDHIELLGSTRDDAAGEAFDKTARIIGLPYPGGPAISQTAENFKGELSNVFPRPMIDSDDYDFSFSGLKTAVLNYARENKNFNTDEMAAEIQESITDVLVAKTIKAVKTYKPKSFLLSGGVAANKSLRKKLEKELSNSKTKLFIPEPKYCTDNGAAIAMAAYYHNNPIPWQDVNANPELTILDK